MAYTISTIASWDWPDHWPELFDILMAALKENEEFAVQGCVRVLKELVRDLGDSQVSNVAPVILPDMYRIFMEKEQYSVRTRSRAIEIFNTLTTMICTMAETDKSIFKAILGPILPFFTEALVSGLSIPDDSHFTDRGLKMVVLKGEWKIFFLLFLQRFVSVNQESRATAKFVMKQRGCEILVQTKLKASASKCSLC